MKKTKFTYRLMIGSTLLLTPLVSFAALAGLKDLLIGIKDLVNLAFPVLIGLAVLFFFWGLINFIRKDSADSKTREDGKQKMLWGIISLFVMVAIFGILQWIGSAIGIQPNLSGGLVPTGSGNVNWEGVTSPTFGGTNTSSGSTGSGVTFPSSINF